MIEWLDRIGSVYWQCRRKLHYKELQECLNRIWVVAQKGMAVFGQFLHCSCHFESCSTEIRHSYRDLALSNKFL